MYSMNPYNQSLDNKNIVYPWASRKQSNLSLFASGKEDLCLENVWNRVNFSYRV